MSKIGLCLAYSGQNYGMLLQAYATQQLLEDKGYKTEIINYIADKNRKIRFDPGLIVFGWNQFIKKIKPRPKAIPLDALHKQNKLDRIAAGKAFRDEHLHHIVNYRGIDALKKAGAENFDAVMVGSDQQWLPPVAFSNFKTMRFVPDNILKLSYSASFGVAQLPWHTRHAAKQFLNRINHIAVREASGKAIVESLTQKKATLVLDPTYLLTADQWAQRFPITRPIKEPYVLCYFLGNNEESKKAARAYADKQGLKLVSILSDESVSSIDISFADEIITGKGPEVFLNLIRHADCVMTDSFHGIAFSIIHNRQFFVFYRNKPTDKNSRNTRIDNILGMFNLRAQLVNDPSSWLKEEFSSIDYEVVNNILEQRCKDSMTYLDNALSSLQNTQ